MAFAKLLCITTLALAVASAEVCAQDDIKRQPIELPAVGKTASFKGKIHGYASVDYIFKATAGQKVRIDFKTANTSAYFNLLHDGSDDALHIGSTSGARYQGMLPSAGDYRIRVYLMRSAARRNASAMYQVTLRVE